MVLFKRKSPPPHISEKMAKVLLNEIILDFTENNTEIGKADWKRGGIVR